MKSPQDRFEIHVDVVESTPGAVDALSDASGLSRRSVKLAMAKGAVWLTRGAKTQRLRRATRKLRRGDELHLYHDARVLAEIPTEPELVDDAVAYSVWNKPHGMRSQGSKWGDHCTVARWAEQHLDRPAFVVHRLDRAATGVIVVAHSRSAAAELSRQFREREVKKRYRVWVHGEFSEDAGALRVEQVLDGKPAVSEVACVLVQDGRSCLDVRIETGRKHQVRRHLAGIGFPIVGDRLYGRGERDGVDLQLMAVELAFRCPARQVGVNYQLATVIGCAEGAGGAIDNVLDAVLRSTSGAVISCE